MHQVTLIRQTLQPYLNWHGARITFLALFLVALFRTRTINFAELALGFPGKAKSESNRKRLNRFFGEFELNYFTIAQLVVALMNIPQPWTLSIDRTTWVVRQLLPQHPDAGSGTQWCGLSPPIVDAR